MQCEYQLDETSRFVLTGWVESNSDHISENVVTILKYRYYRIETIWLDVGEVLYYARGLSWGRYQIPPLRSSRTDRCHAGAQVRNGDLGAIPQSLPPSFLLVSLTPTINQHCSIRLLSFPIRKISPNSLHHLLLPSCLCLSQAKSKICISDAWNWRRPGAQNNRDSRP